MHSAPHKKNQYVRLVRSFKKVRALVVGDVMLDVFTYGTSTRLSPEAPVPVVVSERDVLVPGGAGHVAASLSALGARVTLCTVTGTDSAGATLRTLLKERSVSLSGVVTVPSHPTTSKQRIIFDGHHALRLDREVRRVDARVVRNITKRARALLAKVDVLLLVDYDKGLLTKALVTTLIRKASKMGIPVIADMKPDSARWYIGVTLIAPNLYEARRMSGITNPERAGKKLATELRTTVLLTRGKDGMLVCTPETTEHHAACSTSPVDVSGAGDTVTAVAALVSAVRGSLSDAAYVASVAAGIAVEKPGTATVSLRELCAVLRNKLHE